MEYRGWRSECSLAQRRAMMMMMSVGWMNAAIHAAIRSKVQKNGKKQMSQAQRSDDETMRNGRWRMASGKLRRRPVVIFFRLGGTWLPPASVTKTRAHVRSSGQLGASFRACTCPYLPVPARVVALACLWPSFFPCFAAMWYGKDGRDWHLCAHRSRKLLACSGKLALTSSFRLECVVITPVMDGFSFQGCSTQHCRQKVIRV